MLNAIFRADDVGISRSTALAARLAVENGVCRNVSVQAVGPHLDLVRELIVPLQRTKRINIGLHVTLNCEWDFPRFRPVGRHPHPGLLDSDGAFVQQPGILHERAVPGEAVLAEAEAQLAQLAANGITPDYVDEHMCFGWVPSLKGALTGFCARHGLREVDRIRFTEPPKCPRQAGPVEDALSRLAALSAGLLRIVGHPVLPDNENGRFRLRGKPDYDLNSDRDAQRRMFTDPRITAQVASGRVATLRYDQV
jgi:chitin disaccharide deacetylase